MSIGKPFSITSRVMRSWWTFMSMMIAFQVWISSGVPILIKVSFSLFVWSHSVGRGLIASREAGFYCWWFAVEFELPEWAFLLPASPNLNSILKHPAAASTINSPAHLDSPPHKKPLNLFSLSYLSMEREKRLNVWLRPSRAAKTNAALERRERLLRANLKPAAMSERSELTIYVRLRRRGSISRKPGATFDRQSVVFYPAAP
jgi:hypothetical protein